MLFGVCRLRWGAPRSLSRPRSSQRALVAVSSPPRRAKASPGTPRHTTARHGTPRAPRRTKTHHGTPRHTKAHQGTPRHTKAAQGWPSHRPFGNLLHLFLFGVVWRLPCVGSAMVAFAPTFCAQWPLWGWAASVGLGGLPGPGVSSGLGGLLGPGRLPRAWMASSGLGSLGGAWAIVVSRGPFLPRPLLISSCCRSRRYY